MLKCNESVMISPENEVHVILLICYYGNISLYGVNVERNSTTVI